MVFGLFAHFFETNNFSYLMKSYYEHMHDKN